MYRVKVEQRNEDGVWEEIYSQIVNVLVIKDMVDVVNGSCCPRNFTPLKDFPGS